MERNIIFLYSGRISPKDIKTTTIGDMVSLMKVSKMDAFSSSLVQKHSNLAYIYIYIYIYIYKQEISVCMCCVVKINRKHICLTNFRILFILSHVCVTSLIDEYTY